MALADRNLFGKLADAFAQQTGQFAAKFSARAVPDHLRDHCDRQSHGAKPDDQTSTPNGIIVVKAIAIARACRRRDEAALLVKPQGLGRDAQARRELADDHSRITPRATAPPSHRQRGRCAIPPAHRLHRQSRRWRTPPRLAERNRTATWPGVRLPPTPRRGEPRR